MNNNINIVLEIKQFFRRFCSTFHSPFVILQAIPQFSSVIMINLISKSGDGSFGECVIRFYHFLALSYNTADRKKHTNTQNKYLISSIRCDNIFKITVIP